MRTILTISLCLFATVFTVWACTVQTEDDSVPGDGHGWGGLYYYYTPYTGYLIDGKHEDFVGTDDSIINHYLVAEGVVGFCKDFYAKVNVPYSSTTSKTTFITPGPNPQTITHEDSVDGVGDVLVAAKWAFLNPDEGPRAGVLVGAYLPTGDEEEGLGLGMVAPKAQLVAGTPAGPGRLYVGAGYTMIPENEGFDAGDVVGYTLTYDLYAGSGLTFPLEIIGSMQMKSKTDGEEVAESGSHILSVSPCVTYTPIKWATVCAGVIVPVLKQGYTTDYDYQPHLTFFYNF